MYDVILLALLGAPYMYDISRLKVKTLKVLVILGVKFIA
jgi:hypothetical protein